MERYSIDLAIDLLRRLDVIDQLGAKWRSADELCHVPFFSAAFSVSLLGLDFGAPGRGPAAWRHEPTVIPTFNHMRHAPWQPELERFACCGGLILIPPIQRLLDLLDHAASLYPAVARRRARAGDHQPLRTRQGILLWFELFFTTTI